MFKNMNLPLNSLEKFLMAHETTEISYNTQLVVEFAGDFNLQQFSNALEIVINEIPLLRSRVYLGYYSYQRTYVKNRSYLMSDVLEFKDTILSQDELDLFCKTKFDLKNGKCFKFLVTKTPEGKFRLIFNCHHSVTDAGGQFQILEEIFKVMDGKTVNPAAKNSKPFRYRDLFRIMGLKWMLTHFFKNMKTLSRKRKHHMASIVENKNTKERTVTSTHMFLSDTQQSHLKELCSAHGVTAVEYLSFNVMRALDETLKDQGDFETPIMAYVPKNLRPNLKIRYSLQNILSTIALVGRRKDIHRIEYLHKIKNIIQGHKMEQAAKFIFNSLMPCTLSSAKTIGKFIAKLDSMTGPNHASVLISCGKVSRLYHFPKAWRDIHVWARGGLTSAPALGVIFTGTHEKESITLEYVKELVSKETIESFKFNLLKNLFVTHYVVESEMVEESSVSAAYEKNLIA
jgi:NRPS condensation-like uncharacterized protein